MTQRQTRLLIVLATVALLIAALSLRLLTYDRFLPALDYSDESNMFLLAVDWRADEVALARDYGADLTGDWLQGYPPLYGWLGVWGQRALEAATTRFLFPGDYIGAMRLLSVGASVLTVAGLLALGWSAARPVVGEGWAALAGWLTALPYALSPQIIDIGNLAIPDALIPLGVVLALLGAVRAITRGRWGWLVVSLLGAVLAIYLKYSLFFALWPTFCAWLVLMRRDWRGGLPWTGLLALISAATAGYLLWGYGALGLENQEAEAFRREGFARITSLHRNLTNLWVAFDVSTGLWLFLAVFAAGMGAYVLARRRNKQTFPAAGLWLLLPTLLGNMLLTSSVVYANVELGGYGRVRYMFPGAMIVSLLWALMAVQALHLLRGRLRALALAGLVAITAGPMLFNDAALVARYAQTHNHYRLWTWSDASIPPEGKILMSRASSTHLVWNRPYSGYDGQTTFEWAHDDNPQRSSPQAAYDAGLAYFVVTDRDRQTVYTGAADWIAQLWPLKTFPAGPGTFGDTITVYRMIAPGQPADVVFGGEIVLLGYDLSAETIAPGDVVAFRPYWGTQQPPSANVSMFVHFYPAGEPSNVLAQHDGPPVTEQRLPVTWEDPDEQFIGADVGLAVPPDLPPGDYVLALGLYDFTTGARLPLPDGADRYEIPLTVE